jgi:hypothetical protein
MSAKKEDWMQSKWRPAMGWLYMATCAFDFIIFPVGWSVLQAVTKAPLTQWMPLTLQGAGLFHLAMGAVLGIAAYGRTQEKLGGAAGPSVGGFPGGGSPTPGFTGASAPSFGNTVSSTGFGSPAPSTTPGFGSTSITPAPSFGSTPATDPNAGWGTPAPTPAPTPIATSTGVTNPSWGQGKPGAPKSSKPSARIVLPDNDGDADAKIK